MNIKTILSLLFIATVAGYIYLQNKRVLQQKKKINNLTVELKECNSTNKAKEFEINWSNEFLTQFKETEKERVDEKSTNNNSNNISFNDSF